MADIRRSMLFIPGNNPGMITNSFIFGADSIILDLEDAVSPGEKDSARILVRNALKTLDFNGIEKIVRINSLPTPYFQKDLEMMVPLRPDVIMPTKVQSPEDIREIDICISKLEEEWGIPKFRIKLMPLLETALGIENAFAIAKASSRIAALYLGAEDLTADLVARRTKEGKEIFYSRSRIIVAARAAGLPAIDTPYTDINDEEGLKKDTIFAKEMGFSGKAVISPRHVDIVNEIFTPSAEAINYAERVIEAIEIAKKQGKGAVSLDGKMIDAPIVERAKQVLSIAESLKGGLRK